MGKIKEFHVMLLNAFTNTFLAIVKIIIGFIFNSSLLLADGVDSVTDILTDIFSMISIKFAEIPSDDGHPHGHGALEYAGSLTVAVVIIFLTIILTVDFINDIKNPLDSIDNIVFIVAIITLIIKLILVIYTNKKAKQFDSLTLKASALDSKADVYSAIFIIIGLALTGIGLKLNINMLIYAEKVATLFIIIMLYKTGITIYASAFIEIAGMHANDEIYEKYKDLIYKFDKNLNIKELVIIKEGIYYRINLIIKINENENINSVKIKTKELKNYLLSIDKISFATVEIE